MKEVWRLHKGEPRVPHRDVVKVLFRDGVVLRTDAFSEGGSCAIMDSLWKHWNSKADIIAYHVKGEMR